MRLRLNTASELESEHLPWTFPESELDPPLVKLSAVTSMNQTCVG